MTDGREREGGRVDGVTVGLATLGCKVSQYETEAIAEALEARGFLRRPFEDACDLYVINTCTVTEESDRKSRQMIRRAHRANPAAPIFVTGCYSQISPSEVAALDGVVYVSGSDRKLALADRALSLFSGEPLPVSPTVSVGDIGCAAFEPMAVRHAPRTRAYVKIEDGCECRCAYCTIPAARGNVRSKAPEDVLSEVRGLVGSGTREIVLTGIETASYGADFGDYRLVDLLELLDRESGAERIRLGSLTPEMMTERAVERLAGLSHLAPHFHLSMQSGSDAILRAMRRRYLTDRALSALSRLRRAIPTVQFTTDMMVGFPGESEALFAETEAFCREARFLRMHVFAYSRRPGTPAADFPDQVPEADKKSRSARLIALDGEIRRSILDGICQRGEPLNVLTETVRDGIARGHSDEFFEVELAGGPAQGELCRALPLSHNGNILRARIL